MENWEIDFEWLRVQHVVKDTMQRDKLPDLQGILFLVGVQELGLLQKKFSKEEKQDLMHVAVCKLLSYEGYYEFVGRDEDGWPHYQQTMEVPERTVEEQETMLKKHLVTYFKELELENGGFKI